MKIIAPVLLFLTIITLCITAVVVPSCHSATDCKNPANAASASCVAQQAVIDCTAPTAVDYVTQHEAEISKFFTPAGIDWGAVEDALIKLVLPEAICVLDNVVEHYLTPAPATNADAGVGLKLHAPVDYASVRSKAAEVSAKLWPGKKTKR